MSADAPAQIGAKGAVETFEPTRAQRTAARRMAEAKATIPDFQAAIEVDVTDVPEGVAPYVAAAGRALLGHPRVNGAYVDGAIQVHGRANVGVVIADGEARAVPTVLDADAKAPDAIAGELDAASTQLRDGSLTSAVQANATFTLARLDVTAFTAIIQTGQAAALAIGTPVDRLALRDGAPAVRRVATLTLSADSRIVATTDAAAFLNALRALLEATA